MSETPLGSLHHIFFLGPVGLKLSLKYSRIYNKVIFNNETGVFNYDCS